MKITFVWWGDKLGRTISSLAWDVSLSNLAILLILRRSFQWCRGISPNWSMSKVEKPWKGPFSFKHHQRMFGRSYQFSILFTSPSRWDFMSRTITPSGTFLDRYGRLQRGVSLVLFMFHKAQDTHRHTTTNFPHQQISPQWTLSLQISSKDYAGNCYLWLM